MAADMSGAPAMVPPENYDISTHRLKAGCSASELRGPGTEPRKVCGTCSESKALTEFNRRARSPDGLQSVCRECNRESARRYYAANREKHIQVIGERKRQRRRQLQRFVADYLRAHPCLDCGATDLRVLDFDHRPNEIKREAVMKLVVLGFSESIVMAEIEKCDVRCRNCHAIVTYERMGRNWRTEAMLVAEAVPVAETVPESRSTPEA